MYSPLCPLQEVGTREIKKMLGTHNKDVTTLQKKLNTMVGFNKTTNTLFV